MIATERLCLRPFRPDDLSDLHRITTDPEAMRYWDRPAYTSEDETRALLGFFMAERPDHIEFAVTLDGVFIGRVGMWKLWEVGYLFHPDVWGRGYATEAMQALLTEVPKRFPEAHTLTAEIDPRNIGSARVLEKLGFTCTGHAEKNFLYGGTDWCDTAYYSREVHVASQPV